MCSVVDKADQPLAEIFAAVKLGDRAGAVLDAVDDVLAIAQTAFTHPSGQPRDRFLVAMLIVKDEEPCHARAVDQQMTLDARTERMRIPASH